VLLSLFRRDVPSKLGRRLSGAKPAVGPNERL
jgi:hypothetical protein